MTIFHQVDLEGRVLNVLGVFSSPELVLQKTYTGVLFLIGICSAIGMAEVIVMGVVEVVVATVVVVAAIVMVTDLGARIVRTEGLMPERVVLTTVVIGTASEAVIVTQVVIAMPVLGEALGERRHDTREVPEIDRVLMTGPVVDLEVMMIVTENAGTRMQAV